MYNGCLCFFPYILFFFPEANFIWGFPVRSCRVSRGTNYCTGSACAKPRANTDWVSIYKRTHVISYYIYIPEPEVPVPKPKVMYLHTYVKTKKKIPRKNKTAHPWYTRDGRMTKKKKKNPYLRRIYYYYLLYAIILCIYR